MKDKLTWSARWPLPTLPTRTRHSALRIPHSAFRRLTLATAGAVWMLIVLGGLVRVTDSGTGCGASWPMCHGHLLPSLEYHELIEWNHRLFATLGGLLMVVTVGATLLWYRRDRRLAGLALLAAATYLGQAILGGLTVLLHLDHTWVAAHMGNSMILLGSLTLLALFTRGQGSGVRDQGSATSDAAGAITDLAVLRSSKIENRKSKIAQSAIKWLSLGTLIWTFVAMLTGSAVVGAGADLSCPAWPQCADANLLPADYQQWVNFTHRIAVGFSDVLMLVLTIAVWRLRRDDRRLLRSAHALALLYVSQVFLGAFTIWLQAPAWIRGMHLALAAATWAALVVMTALIWEGVRDRGPGTGDRGSENDVPLPIIQNRKSKIENPSVVATYFGLIKPRVIPLLLVPTVASMLMAAAQHPTDRPLLPLIFFTMLGGTLAAGGAHAINQFWDRDIDALMRRTKRRAVVTGQIPPLRALVFGVALSTLAFTLMWATVNLLAAVLALAGNLFYVFVYTIWLKRTSAQNIVIGGAAGAVPPLVGWAAVTGRIDLPALLFFAIIFFWTPAHFWALALVRQEDYRAAGIPMLPVVRGEEYTRKNILAYAVMLLVVTLLPFATHSLSWLYLASAAVLGGVFVARAVGLMRNASIARAWHLFKFSNIYHAVLYLAMVADRLIALGGVHLG
jgi:protoheme IX farnesyltransferase